MAEMVDALDFTQGRVIVVHCSEEPQSDNDTHDNRYDGDSE